MKWWRNQKYFHMLTIFSYSQTQAAIELECFIIVFFGVGISWFLPFFCFMGTKCNRSHSVIVEKRAKSGNTLELAKEPSMGSHSDPLCCLCQVSHGEQATTGDCWGKLHTGGKGDAAAKLKISRVYFWLSTSSLTTGLSSSNCLASSLGLDPGVEQDGVSVLEGKHLSSQHCAFSFSSKVFYDRVRMISKHMGECCS